MHCPWSSEHMVCLCTYQPFLNLSGSASGNGKSSMLLTNRVQNHLPRAPMGQCFVSLLRRTLTYEAWLLCNLQEAKCCQLHAVGEHSCSCAATPAPGSMIHTPCWSCLPSAQS